MSLTSKQEVFVQAIVSGKNQSDAYRVAYNVGSGTKAATINKRASELMSNRDIAGRIAELRKPVIDSAKLTLEGHLNDLLKLRNLAAKDNKWSAAIQAEIARGKASGLQVEKHELGGTVVLQLMGADTRL